MDDMKKNPIELQEMKNKIPKMKIPWIKLTTDQILQKERLANLIMQQKFIRNEMKQRKKMWWWREDPEGKYQMV